MLIDSSGPTDGNRLGVFKNKPAPLSLTWLGFGSTTGLTSIDYFLTDKWVVPSSTRQVLVKKFLHEDYGLVYNIGR